MKTFLLFGLLLLAGFACVHSQCPEAKNILPCVCHDNQSPKLWCDNINDAVALKRVFVNSVEHSYIEVHIENSSLQFLPSTLFEEVQVRSLYLKNVTLLALFDRPPSTLSGLWKLSLDSTVVLRGILWKLLEPLKNLKVLDVNFIEVKTLGKDFSRNLPKEIESVSFFTTGTKTIESGIFDGFTKLDKFEVSAGKLQKLTRDILPVPFNGRILYFNGNKLTKIPDNMFSQMPNLQSLGLNRNRIATFPESAFSGTGSKLEYFFLEDNPIKCDCKIYWLLRIKPPVLTGKCESPKGLHGRELKSLTSDDLNC